MSSGGRKFHNYWESGEYDAIRLSKNKNGAMCKICGHVLKNTSKSRLVAHRSLCKRNSSYNNNEEIIVLDVIEENEVDMNSNTDRNSTTDDNLSLDMEGLIDTSKSIKNNHNDTNSTYIPEESTDSSSQIVNNETSKNKMVCKRKRLSESGWKKDNQFKNFFDNISNVQKEKLDRALTLFVVGCNLPFSTVDSRFFKTFIQELRPAYSVPCSKTLSGSLLNSVHEEIVKTDRANVGETSVMLIDGWKNSSNNTKQVVTILHSVGGQCCFLDSYDITGNSETGEELYNICQNSITLAKERYDTDVYAIVSDNAANMLKMGRLSSNLMHSTCNSHTGNLLAKDILDLATASKVSLILREFKHPDLEKDIISDGGSKIQLAVDTRWASYRDAFVCLIQNLGHMKTIAAKSNVKVKTNIVSLLYDESFIQNVEKAIDVSNNVCLLINECQSRECSLADASEKWLKLELPDECQEFLKNRKNMALNIYALASNYLHPSYRGNLLTEGQIDQVEKYLLENLDKEGLSSLQQFNMNADIFKILLEKEITCPVTYWGLASRKHDQLSKLAVKLLNIPASSAQLERVFSSWSFIHSDLRNRLGSEKSKKLVHCYYSLHLSHTSTTNID